MSENFKPDLLPMNGSDFKLFLSNELEILYQKFKESIFVQGSNLFTRRLVVVYGPAMKNWLMLKMAEDPELGIASGFEVVYLHEAFQLFSQIFQKQCSIYEPTQIELSFAIESEIKKILRSNDSDEQEQQVWNPLIRFLGLNEKKITPRVEKRLISLSQQLAKCFRDYGRYGAQLVEEWENSRLVSGWQEALWKRLFCSQYKWTTFSHACRKPIQCDEDVNLFFFSISYLSSSEFQYLQRLSCETSVNYFILSPCAVFWSDIRSDKESSYLLAYWQKKLGDSSQVAALEELLRDKNPLLANFGRLGREMAHQIEESNVEISSLYSIPRSTLQLGLDIHQDISIVETNKPLTLLQAIQTDILFMRNLQESSDIQLESSDSSFQLHIAPTIYREVEILYHTLLGLFENNPTLQPSDIMVLSPQIIEYAPFIKSVFGAPDSQLNYQIMDLGLQEQSEIIQGFLLLLRLSESRWEADVLLQLFEHPWFQRKQQFAPGDYRHIFRWINETGIQWGETSDHRNEILEKSHCDQKIVSNTRVGTWEHGFSQLIDGLTVSSKGAFNFASDIMPYSGIEFSQADILEKWIRLIHALRDDLAPLQDRSELTLDEWVDFLHCLLESYFQPDYHDLKSVEEFKNFKDDLDQLRSKQLQGVKFPFSSIKERLSFLLQQSGRVYRENQLQVVRFCSTMPLRTIPTKVIALMGMHEGTFPRNSEPISLNLLHDFEGADYCPTTIDYDRYLFLEVLQSAKEHLVITCQGYNHQDGKELNLSLVVEELFVYMDKHYSIENEKISQCRTYRHPFDSFDKSYFKAGSELKNFSVNDFKAAQALISNKKQNQAFIHEFSLAESVHQEFFPNHPIIDIQNLISAAKNPIKLYLNKTLEIYLQTYEDRKVKIEEDLQITGLNKYLIKHEGLKGSFTGSLQQAEKKGMLPFGLFKDLAQKQMYNESEELLKSLQSHGICNEDIFSITFCPSCSEPIQNNKKNWLLPPLSILLSENCQVQIVGELSMVTPKGLLAISSGSLQDIWKIWPQYLIYLYAAEQLPSQPEKSLILSKTSKAKMPFFDTPAHHLKRFIHYYSLCQQQLSPLMPDWIPFILKGDSQGLQKKMRELFAENSYQEEYQGLYLKWIMNKNLLPNSETLIQKWRSYTQDLIQDIVKEWCSKKDSDKAV